MGGVKLWGGTGPPGIDGLLALATTRAQQATYAGTKPDTSRRLPAESTAIMMTTEDEVDDAAGIATDRTALGLATRALAADLNIDPPSADFASGGRRMLSKGNTQNPLYPS